MCVYCRPQPGELDPPPGLTPRTVERNVLKSMDLLERAAALIHDQWDGMAPDTDGRRWLADYKILEEFDG